MSRELTQPIGVTARLTQEVQSTEIVLLNATIRFPYGGNPGEIVIQWGALYDGKPATMSSIAVPRNDLDALFANLTQDALYRYVATQLGSDIRDTRT